MAGTSHNGTLASALIASSLDAVIVIDESKRIVEFNPMAERIFGYARHRAIGAALDELIVPPAVGARHEAGYRRHAETGIGRVIGKRTEIEACAPTAR